MEIIDAHSHIGIDNAWDIEGKIEEYLKETKQLGITKSFLMPVPMPIIKVGNNEITPIMIGIYEEEYLIVQGLKDKNGIRPVLVSTDPYKYVNEILHNKTKNNKDLYFVPLIHPLFDTFDYLEEMTEKYKPVALKIHGYSSIISPKEIEDDFWKFIKRINIPLIIHTDCDITDHQTIDNYYRNENTPYNWIQTLNKYSIKAYLTHGIRLCKKSIKLIKDNPNYVVGLGPDLLLSNTKDRMYSQSPYLDTLFSNIDIDQICFDIDYPWNVENYEECKMDWKSLERIKSLQLKRSELEKVLSKNAKQFFKIN